MTKTLLASALLALSLASCAPSLTTQRAAQYPAAPTTDGKVKVLGEYTLAPTPLETFGYSAEMLARAQQNGLRRTDLPAIGSGLTLLPDGTFMGITDRGPNEDHLDAAGKSDGKVFPLPEFSPSLVRFGLQDDQIKILSIARLNDGRHGINGLTNLPGEETPWPSAEAKAPYTLSQGGMDTEAIARFPDGRFIVADETSPSLAVLSPTGQVLVRYTPASKPLPETGYPVRNILPDIFEQRRVNRGFENVALSGDGKTAWVTLQSPMGAPKADEYKGSRVIRTLKLDVSDPLNATVSSEYLTVASAIADYPKSDKQADLKVSDTAWITGDKLLTLERANGLVKLFVDDFGAATDVLGRSDAGTLTYENTATDLAALGIQTATRREVFNSEQAGISIDKLEGLAILSPSVVALANDNDFGIGDNKDGTPSKVWIVQLAEALR